jgi:putative tricarboxylic transport membrane protein
MTEQSHDSGPTYRSVEVGVAVFMVAFGLIIVAGSLQAGIDWGAEGPRAGFFPFYVALLLIGASIVNLVQVNALVPRGRLFADWGQLGQVMSVVAPTTVYVLLVPYIGIYLASMLLIAAFMFYLGHYPWTRVLPIALGVPIVTFAVFEKWFLVPLPKGPIEALLGF